MGNIHIEFINDGTILENLKVEFMTRSGTPRWNLIRNGYALRGFRGLSIGGIRRWR
ncbi:hypothetical protein MtrunA17_Chr7g0220471 [Medicago truncatula]|uniref:Uncharacterized protein n=1 Tax=Medicago truncatula TaxID=3880 RepID=A0A396H0V8_MEDTR|nr:hypothetical protein MtrunA17_Chr7g0220471 [Medicago truncatula]